MRAWLTYLMERFPLPVYLLLVGGFSLSGLQLGGGFRTGPFVLGFGGVLLFFWLLRLMDEFKDYAKDQIAHPERPLPRGLLGTTQVAQAIRLGSGLMIGWAVLVGVLTNLVAGACYLLVTTYLWLMYREFYSGQWLEQRPLLYALSHQFILLLICGFCVAVGRADLLGDPSTGFFGLCILGAFFTYEVCRKLDPQAHPVLGTYLVVYGRIRTIAIVLAATLIAAVGAAGLDLHVLLWPAEALMLLSLVLLWWKPEAYKLPEVLAGLSLLLHLWAIPLRRLGCEFMGWCGA